MVSWQRVQIYNVQKLNILKKSHKKEQDESSKLVLSFFFYYQNNYKKLSFPRYKIRKKHHMYKYKYFTSPPKNSLWSNEIKP